MKNAASINEVFDNVDGYLNSPNFRKYVGAIARRLSVNENCEFYDDISQECAIAVIEAFNTFDPQKCGGFNFFWGHAYLRMYEYAKRELNKQVNPVHIPINRANSAFSNEKRKYAYEQIKHTYVRGLMFEKATGLNCDIETVGDNESASHNFRASVPENRDVSDFNAYQIAMSSDNDAIIDIAEAFKLLPNDCKDAVGMRIGSIPTNNGKNDYDSIAKTLGISKRNAQCLYAKGRDFLKEKLSCYTK